MINLSYGHISKKFINFDYVRRVIKNFLYNINFSQYTTPGGSKLLREEIAKKYLSDNKKIDYCCTSVSTNLSFFILLSLFTKAKKIGIFTPLYLNYYKQVLDVKSKHIVTYSYDDLANASILFSELTAGDVCIIVLPNNPTGQVISLKALEKNLKLMYGKGISCIIDISWIYSVFTDDKKMSIDELAKLAIKYNSVLLVGFTKIFGVTSIRCSGVIAPPNIISSFIKQHDCLAVSCGSLDELLVYNFLHDKSPVDWVDVGKYLKKQSTFIIDVLKKTGIKFEFSQPEAGIFLYVRFPKINNASEISEKCKNNNLLIYPSNAFEERSDGFRLCYCNSKKEIKEGIKILSRIIKEAN